MGSLTYGMIQWAFGIMRFPNFIPCLPLWVHGLANKSPVLVRMGSGTKRVWIFCWSRGLVLMAAKHWPLHSTCFPVNSSSTSHPLMSFSLKVPQCLIDLSQYEAFSAEFWYRNYCIFIKSTVLRENFIISYGKRLKQRIKSPCLYTTPRIHLWVIVK